MNNFPKYSSIDNLTSKSDILNYECVVTEKIHGTNARFGISSEDGILVGSRNNIVHKGSELLNNQHDGHYGFVGWVLNQHELLSQIATVYPDHIFYGEWCGSNIQKGIKYCNEKELYIFDIKDENGVYLDWDNVIHACTILGLNHVPEIVRGIIPVEELTRMLDQVSVVGKRNGFTDPDNTQEGFVIKTLKTQYDNRGNRMIAKYKSEKWAEKAKAPKPKLLDPEKLKLHEEARIFAESVTTLGKITTIIDHIVRDSGNEELSMKRTPEFLKEFVNDVMKDNEEVYNLLDKQQKNIYNKTVSSIAARKWKEYILRL